MKALSGVFHHDADWLAQRLEGGFNLIRARMVIQVEEAIYHSLRNADVMQDLSRRKNLMWL